MKKLIWIAVLGLVLIGCKAKSAPQASPATPAAAATRPISTPTTTVRVEDEYHAVTAVYESSKTQEGATDFFFRTDDGEMIKFRYSDLTEEEPSIVLPVPLVAEGPEGTEGPNPEWVGRRFLLTLNALNEVVSLEPIPVEQQSGASEPEAKKPENAASEGTESVTKSLQATDQPDLESVQLMLPPGFTAGELSSHEGTAVTVQGGAGELHIFLPNPEVSSTGETGVLGEQGLFESNGWTLLDAGRQSQPAVGWASASYPFTGGDDLEGTVWLGRLGGREVRVTASAPPDQLDDYYRSIGSVIQGMRLR